MKKIFLFLIFFSTNYFLYSQGRQADAYGETAIGVNSYSITIKAITDASIYDKQSIWFRGNSNTSTSTLKVYGAGSISYPEIEITNNGSSLNAGDIVANQWYQLKYSLALNKWQIQKSNLFTSISATSPLSISGGSTSTISITSPIPLAIGGTNASITAADGAIFYSNATKGALTATNKAYWDYTNGFLGLGKNSGLNATLTAVSTGTTYASSPLVLLNSANDTIFKVRSDGKIKACDPLSNLYIGSNNGQYNTTGSKNTSLGYGSLITNIIGTDNTTVGYDAGIQIVGSVNTAIGSLSQVLSTSSNANTSVGYTSLFSNVSGGNNSALGVGAGYNSLGNYNSFWGYHAGYDWTGSNRTFIQAGQRDSAVTIDGNNGQFNITNGHIKIVDGSQGSGKVLISDANGLGTWTTLSTGVSSVSATSPLSSSGGATPTISITSPIPIANGGTNSTIAASAGSVIYSTSSAHAMTAVGNPGQILQSNGTAAPSFVSDIIPNTVTTTSLSVTTSATTNPISLNIATHGDNSTTSYVTGVNINADQGLNVTGLNINASAINGGVANAGTFNSIASNALGYNNGIGCFSSNGKYNTSGNFQAMGGTNAIAASLWASGASTKNAALDILFGAIYLSGSAGTSGQVLTSAGSGSTPTWQTPSTSPSASVTVTDDNSTNSPYFPTWVTGAGTPALKMSSARVVFNPSNGRIGFNTASVTPTYDLSFGGTAARTLGVEQNTTSNTAGSNLTTYAGGATSGATDKDGGNYIINSGTSTGTGNSAIYFQTATSGTTGTSTNAVSTKMIIAGSGRVGIGTTGPDALLDVSQTNGSLALKITNSSVGTTGWFAYPSTNGSETDLRWGQKKADNSLPDWFTFQSGGNLGIGTTSPSSKLHIVDANDPTTNGAAIIVSLTNTVAVNSNTGVNTVVSTTGSGSTNYGFQSVVSGASNSINYGGFFTSQNAATKNYGVYCQAQNATNNYPLVAIGGNVGIGTTTPTQLLQVAGATGTVSVTDAGVINQDGAKTHNHIKLSLADDGTYTLPKDGIIGQVSVITYENNGAASIDGAIDFRYVAYPTTGAGILTQIRSTDAVNAATSDTDTKLCAYMSGEDVIIKNRLGEAKNLLILFDYY